jgi:uncharacterized membrane protein
MTDQSALKKEWPILLTLSLNVALIAWTWNRIPESVPVHWNMQGEVNRYGGRFEALAMMPLILLVASLLLLVIQRAMPANAGVIRVVRLAEALLGVIFTTQYAFDWGALKVALVGIGVFFALIGNVMGKVQPSPWVGFRTRWTFLSKQAWHKSQRRSGLFLVCFGLLSSLVGLITPEAWLFPWIMPLAFIGVLFGGIGWLNHLSHRDFRQDPHPEPISSAQG